MPGVTIKETIQGKQPAAEILELFPLQGEWTEEDYFRLPETNRLIELSEGRITILDMPTISHQKILEKLYKAMDAYVENNSLGEVHIAPLPVRLWKDKIREPDIVFYSKIHLDRISDEYMGVPDLAVEIVSKNTEQTDRTEKYYEYAKAGVAEYWIVDPTKQTLEVYALEQKSFVLYGFWSSSEIAKSRLLSGFKVAVGSIM